MPPRDVAPGLRGACGSPWPAGYRRTSAPRLAAPPRQAPCPQEGRERPYRDGARGGDAGPAPTECVRAWRPACAGRRARASAPVLKPTASGGPIRPCTGRMPRAPGSPATAWAAARTARGRRPAPTAGIPGLRPGPSRIRRAPLSVTCGACSGSKVRSARRECRFRAAPGRGRTTAGCGRGGPRTAAPRNCPGTTSR